MAQAGPRRRIFYVTYRDARGAWYARGSESRLRAEEEQPESERDAAELKFAAIPLTTGGARRPPRSGRA